MADCVFRTSVSRTPSLEEDAGVSVSQLKVEMEQSVMPGPPGLVVTNAAGEVQRFDLPKVDIPHLYGPSPDKGKRVIASPSELTKPPHLVLSRASDDLPRPVLNRSKRVMSSPPGGSTRPSIKFPDPARPLRLPQKLAGTSHSRWSDVPANWRHGAVDPLRCHSVDHLPAPEWRN